MSEKENVQGGFGFTKKPCEIYSCSCAHEYQDRKYGKGKRVFNPTKKGYRCTVCRKDKI